MGHMLQTSQAVSSVSVGNAEPAPPSPLLTQRHLVLVLEGYARHLPRTVPVASVGRSVEVLAGRLLARRKLQLNSPPSYVLFLNLAYPLH